jgi:hypothetical protein
MRLYKFLQTYCNRLYLYRKVRRLVELEQENMILTYIYL